MKNSLVRCTKCGREQRVDFAYCLRYGWPKCHGYTMTLLKVKAEVIDKAVGSIVNDAVKSMTVTMRPSP
jgi:hypothetical protein